MKVSIVAAYNNKVEMTKEFLDKWQWSMENEPFEIEMILVNGGNEHDLVHPFVNKLLKLDNNIGFCNTLNAGLNAVSKDSDYIVFTGNDSFPLDRVWLSRLIPLFKEKNVNVVCPAPTNPPLHAPFYKVLYLDEDEDGYYCSMFPSIIWIFKREFLDEVGLLDERYPGSGMYADNDWSMRVTEKYGPKKIFVSKKVILEHRCSSEGKTLGNTDYSKNLKIFEEKWGTEARASYSKNNKPF